MTTAVLCSMLFNENSGRVVNSYKRLNAAGMVDGIFRILEILAHEASFGKQRFKKESVELRVLKGESLIYG